MTNVLLVHLSDALPSCLGSWEDLFAYADRLSRRRGGDPSFAVTRWTPGTPAPDRADLVLVPVRIPEESGTARIRPVSADVTTALRRWFLQGSVVGGVCAGVFCLAEAGLLEGKKVTTHWALCDEFRRRFPRIALDQDALVIEYPGLILGGGMTAYFDVGLAAIRTFAGEQVARDCAALFVIDPYRRFQSPFSPAELPSDTRDPVLDRALDWAFQQPHLGFTVEAWASAIAVEKRTLERRASAAWGFGPAERLRRLRLDRARVLMTRGRLPWTEVSVQCGYQDPAAFRRLFLERFGQTPGEYRRRSGAA